MPTHSFDKIIETERLILRPHTLDDVQPSYEMNLDAEVSRFTGDGGVVSLEEIQYRIEHHVLGDYQKHGYGRMAVLLKSTGKFIGFAGLKYLEDIEEVDLGYRFIKECWGQGLATEACIPLVAFAFNELNLDSICAYVLPDNKGSIRVLEKLNFQFDAEVMEEGELAFKYVLPKP